MVDNIVTKPVGFVLIVAAHMLFNGPSRAEVTAILGTNVTLQFTFNISIAKDSHFAVYRGLTHRVKIAQYLQGKEGGVFDVYPVNRTLSYHITNLNLKHSESYWATLFTNSPLPEESDKVKLIVREQNSSSTVPPIQNDSLIPEDGGSSSRSSSFVTVLVVSPVVLLAAVLPWLIWCLVRTKDKQQQPPQQSSHPTVQETVEASISVPAASLVYSVLDFPKRPPAVLEMNPNDTEYAAVSYLPEKRRV